MEAIKRMDHFINKVICGDCLEVMKDMPDGCVDLVFTDPPYNSENIGPNKRVYSQRKMKLSDEKYKQFCSEWFLEANRIAKNNRIIFTPGIANTHNYPQPYWQICWHKPAAVSFNRMGGFNAWEPVFCYSGPVKGQRLGQDYVLFNTLNFKKGPETGHPCPKVPALWRWLLLQFSKEEDVVLDPFLGSGTTALVCKENNRKYIGIEINPEYCKIAEQRLAMERGIQIENKYAEQIHSALQEILPEEKVPGDFMDSAPHRLTLRDRIRKCIAYNNCLEEVSKRQGKFCLGEE